MDSSARIEVSVLGTSRTEFLLEIKTWARTDLHMARISWLAVLPGPSPEQD